MVVLIDTNILLDFLNKRAPHNVCADKIIELCSNGIIKGYIASVSIPNIFYIMRKDLSAKELRKLLLDLCDIVDIVGIGKQAVKESLLNEDFSDFEDCLQMECAKQVNANYIVTRDLPGFSNSSVEAILPIDFIKIASTIDSPSE
jgi:predicted nucleic acid-binding protein